MIDSKYIRSKYRTVYMQYTKSNMALKIHLLLLIYCVTLNFSYVWCKTWTNSTETITSIDYPKEYPNNTTQIELVKLEKLSNITITLYNLSIELSEGCKADYLVIYREAANGDVSITKDRVCGQLHSIRSICTNENNETCTLPSFISNGFRVKFHSDASVTNNGFLLKYTSEQLTEELFCNKMRPTITGQDEKYYNVTKTYKMTNLIDGTYWYIPNVSCNWTIPVSYQIYGIYITGYMYLKYSGPNCVYDYIEILSAEYQLNGIKLCGSNGQYASEFNHNDKRLGNILVNFQSTYTNRGRFQLALWVFSYKPRPTSKNAVLLLWFQIHRTYKGTVYNKTTIHIKHEEHQKYWQLNSNIFLIDYQFAAFLFTESLIVFVSQHGFHSILSLKIYHQQRVIGTKSGVKPTIRNNRTIFESVGHILTLRCRGCYNILYSSQNEQFKEQRPVLTGCNIYGSLDGVLSLNTGVNIQFDGNYSDKYRACYIVATAPPGYAVSVKVADIDYEFVGATDKCKKEGLVVYDGSFDTKNIIGPFCEIQKGYLNHVFDPLLTSSNKAFIMLYSYPYRFHSTHTTSNAIKQYINIDITASKCKGIHIKPTNETKKYSGATGIKIEVMSNGSKTYRIINITAVHPTIKCTRVMIHPSFDRGLDYKFQFYNMDNISLTMCIYFGEIKGKTTEQHCLSNKTEIENLSWNNREDDNKVWSTKFAVLEIGEAEAPTSLIYTCSNNFNVSNHGLVYIGPEIINYHKNIPCVIMLRLQTKRGSNNYIELFIEEYEGILNINESVSDGQYHVSIYKLRLRRVTYRSLSTRDLFLIHSSHRSRSAGFALIHYQVKPYTHIPVVIDNVIHYRNHQYKLYEMNEGIGKKNYTQKNTTRFEKTCNKHGGNLFTPSTPDELRAVQLVFSTNQHWKRAWLAAIKQHNGLSIMIGLKKESGKKWRWINNQPLVFNDWYYPDQVLHNIPKAAKDDYLFSGQNVQPTKRRGNQCVIMNMYHPRQSTNWHNVDCYKVNELENMPYVICEYDDRNPDTYTPHPNRIAANKHYISSNSPISKSLRKCPQDWIYIQGKCWVMLVNGPKYGRYGFRRAKNDCIEYGGRIADIADLEVVKLYLTFAQHQEYYGNIWTTSHGNKSCIVYESKRDLIQRDFDRLKLTNYCASTFETDMYGFRTYKNQFPESNKMYMKHIPWPSGCSVKNVTHSTITGYVSGTVHCTPKNVFCVHAPVSIMKSCRRGYTPCNDGSCISADLLCDNFNDCTEGEDEVDCNLQDYIFPCVGNGNRTVSISKYCDFLVDCKDKSDEKGCVYPECHDGEFRCKNHQCVDEKFRCNGQSDGCQDRSDEDGCDVCIDGCKACVNGWNCEGSMGECISERKRNDGRLDCTYGSDEKYHSDSDIKEDTLVRKFIKNCHGAVGRCSETTVGCFNARDMCVLGYYSDGLMTGCSNGVHLSNCSSFACPGKYKCPHSYCIDMKLVCNGIVDCQGGDDEVDCDRRVRNGLYLCGGNTTYNIEESDLCNGEFDCPYVFHDEKYCDIKECPVGCECRGYYYNCQGKDTYVDNTTFSDLARVINLSGNEDMGDLISDNFTFSRHLFLAILNNTFSQLFNLITLDLSNNDLYTLGKHNFHDLHRLKLLVLYGNSIQVLIADTFQGLHSITELNLRNLNITRIFNGAFNGLYQIQKLNLISNTIHTIEMGAFKIMKNANGKIKFASILLSKNPLQNTSIDVFREIESEKIVTDHFRFCCKAEVKYCEPSEDIYSSCADLMSNTFLQIAIWLLGCLSVVGNIMVIVCRLKVGLRTPSEVCIFSLSCSDILTGIYLIIIGSADSYYRNDYMDNDIKWRNSATCTVCGVLSTLSSQLSSFLLLLITLDRFIHLVFPMKVVHYSRKTAGIACAIVSLVSVTMVTIPLADTSYFEAYYSKTPLCLAYDFSTRTTGWQYTLVMFILVNLINCIVTMVCYIAIYISVQRSAKNTDPAYKKDVALAKTLFLLVLTDLVCWLPLIFTSLAVIGGHHVRHDMAAMLAVVILPINAALNPYLYTIRSIQNGRAKRSVRKATKRARHTPP